MRRANNLTTSMYRLSWNLGTSTSWNPQGLSRPVMGLLYVYRIFLLLLRILLSTCFVRSLTVNNVSFDICHVSVRDVDLILSALVHVSNYLRSSAIGLRHDGTIICQVFIPWFCDECIQFIVPTKCAAIEYVSRTVSVQAFDLQGAQIFWFKTNCQ
jgi:hypothetical protein